MDRSSGSLQAVLVELEKSFGHTSFKSEVQERAVLSVTEGKERANHTASPHCVTTSTQVLATSSFLCRRELASLSATNYQHFYQMG